MVGYILQAILEAKAVVEQSQRDLLMIILGVILACFKDVFGFTFGSSAGQKRQGEVITKSLEDKDKIIAGNVKTSADVVAAAVSAANAASVVTEPPATIVTTAPTEPSVTPTTTTVTTQEKTP
jgi:hypothetical protein